jgi:signal transduction histidine kinase
MLPAPPRVDVALAAAFVVMTLAEAVLSPDVSSPVEHAVVGGLAMALLAWRRVAPLVVTALIAAVNVLMNPNGEFSTLLSLVLICFTIGSETRPPRSYAGLLMVVVPFIGVSIAHGLVPSDLAAGLVFFVGPWLVGGLVQSRIERSDEAVARAERLERERELEASLDAAEKLTTIAGELNDIVSHSISVVTIQTQPVRRRLGP